jgi:signal transduction histidine kinase
MVKDRWEALNKQVNRKGPVWTWAKIVAIVLVGVILGVISMTLTATVYKNNLRTRINSVAEAFSSRSIDSLKTDSGANQRTVQSDYTYTEGKLARIKEANRDARFLYLMARDSKGNVYFLADSEPENSSANSPRGQAYPEATEGLKAMFDNGRPLIEGPVRDSYGNWLSALAPIVDDNTSQLTAVVGMDVPAASYGLLLACAGGLPLLLSLLAAVILYVRHQTRRRQQEHAQFRAEMLSIASHELRTPLTGLRWSEESLLKQKIADPKQQRSLEIMYDSTLRLEESIEDVLQLASLESGRPQKLYIKEADIRSVIDGVIAMQRLAAERKQVTLAYGGGWPDKLLLECDIQRLKRVFSNIVGNAIKYSDNGAQVTIGYQQSKEEHVFSVHNHGVVIPADEQAHIWDGFYRAGNVTGHEVTGTGMGLYLARSIVEQHNGRIWLESKENEGTTVFIALPVTSPPAATPASTSAEPGKA